MSRLQFAYWTHFDSEALDRWVVRRRKSTPRLTVKKNRTPRHGTECVGCGKTMWTSERKDSMGEGWVRHTGRGFCATCYRKAELRDFESA